VRLIEHIFSYYTNDLFSQRWVSFEISFCKFVRTHFEKYLTGGICKRFKKVECAFPVTGVQGILKQNF